MFQDVGNCIWQLRHIGRRPTVHVRLRWIGPAYFAFFACIFLVLNATLFLVGRHVFADDEQKEVCTGVAHEFELFDDGFCRGFVIAVGEQVFLE